VCEQGHTHEDVCNGQGGCEAAPVVVAKVPGLAQGGIRGGAGSEGKDYLQVWVRQGKQGQEQLSTIFKQALVLVASWQPIGVIYLAEQLSSWC
jgi:hypothetical protein